MRVKVVDGQCRFAYSLDGKRFHEAKQAFAIREGKWIGAKLGFVSEETNLKGNRGWVDADWIRFSKQ